MFGYPVLTIVLILCSDCTIGFIKGSLVRLTFADNDNIKKQLKYNPNSLLNFTERSQKYGYHSETHTVITEDGYILKLFRMLNPNCENLKTPAVLLQHGMFVNAISFLDAGPNIGIAYLLSDQCLDVWCGNFRGTEYSRNHTYLNPDKDAQFWKFSFHEMGLYDLSAMIDYILKKTESNYLLYIGYSQSMSAFVALTSLRPQYVDKFSAVVGMAPGIWHKPSNSLFIKFGVDYRNLLYHITNSIGVQELFHTHSIIQELLQFVCQKSVALNFCSKILLSFDSPHTNSVTDETLTVMFAHLPDGVSIKSMDHIGQIMSSGIFRQYNYGIDNMKFYGEKNPPVYTIENIKTPMFLIYSSNDSVVHAGDVISFSKHLPNLQKYTAWKYQNGITLILFGAISFLNICFLRLWRV